MNNQITVLVESCTMQISLEPFFTQATPTKQKKLLGYVFHEPWRNGETISTLDTYLPQKQAEAKEAWENASKRYQNEYTSTQYRYDLTAEQKRTVEAANRKMLNRSEEHTSELQSDVCSADLFSYLNGLSTQ